MKYSLRTAICAAAFAFTLTVGVSVAYSDSYYDRKVSLFELLPIGADDIVFLGNSITDGGEMAELLGMPNIKNRGITSDRISGVRKRLHQVLDGKPKKLFLLIGINDVPGKATAAKIAGEYAGLVKEIKAISPETKVYLQSVMPINNDFGRYKTLFGREKVIPALNKEIEKIAKVNGMVYVDLWPALSDPTTGKMKREYTNDGLHLTGAGYKAWIDYIRPLVVDSDETE